MVMAAVTAAAIYRFSHFDCLQCFCPTIFLSFFLSFFLPSFFHYCKIGEVAKPICKQGSRSPRSAQKQRCPLFEGYGAARLVPLPTLVGFEGEFGPHWPHEKTTCMYETRVHGVQLTQERECRLGTPESEVKSKNS